MYEEMINFLERKIILCEELDNFLKFLINIKPCIHEKYYKKQGIKFNRII